ncbi:MAG: (d)CMP kinase [Planctomycetota bacterium]|nr:(d)CMP kinase [Planctomycetota bacterium]
MIVAIDGPAASGKSTVARAVAQALDLTFLDTGAMYRALTAAVLERGCALGDGESCARIAEELDLTFDAEGRVLVDGRADEARIRSAAVTAAVSEVAAHPAVRRALVSIQRRVAQDAPGVVAEGRDTTTVVFPGADHKFFLTATSSERARRRALQEGRPEEQDALRLEIERRDAFDSTRADSPLVRASDAVAIDTDGYDAAAVVALILARISAPAHDQQHNSGDNA